MRFLGPHFNCAKSFQSCLTLCDPIDCSPPGSSVLGDSPGKSTGVGCHALLQGIFPIQGLNPRLTSPALAGGFFTTAPPGKRTLWMGRLTDPSPSVRVYSCIYAPSTSGLGPDHSSEPRLGARAAVLALALVRAQLGWVHTCCLRCRRISVGVNRKSFWQASQ